MSIDHLAIHISHNSLKKKKKRLQTVKRLVPPTYPTSATDCEVEEAFCSRNSQAVMTTGSLNNTWETQPKQSHRSKQQTQFKFSPPNDTNGTTESAGKNSTPMENGKRGKEEIFTSSTYSSRLGWTKVWAKSTQGSGRPMAVELGVSIGSQKHCGRNLGFTIWGFLGENFEFLVGFFWFSWRQTQSTERERERERSEGKRRAFMSFSFFPELSETSRFLKQCRLPKSRRFRNEWRFLESCRFSVL